MRLAVRLLAACAALLCFALPAAADETINSFVSDITLRADGSVDVTETIEINAEGDAIRRGIYRDIPTTLINEDRSRLRSALDVISVERDGQPEPFVIEGLGANATRIRIGDAEIFLGYGAHRYVIHYTMTRMGRVFADHAELYWNATGNYWDFPILKSEARVTLPDGAVISDLRAYTGPVGSTESAVTVARTSDTTATFRAQRPLASGEGLTVAASFQTGILTEPQGLEGAAWWLSDHRDLILPLLAVLLVLFYFLLAWRAVGRDPAKGTIIPLFHAPKGLSPALVHYVNKMGWAKTGWTAFTASIFDLGVKGLVGIDNAGKALKVTATGKEPAEKLPAGEAGLFAYFKSEGVVAVNATNGPTLDRKRSEFVSTIETENRQLYFRNNIGYVLIGIALAVLCLGALVLFGVLEPIFLIVAVVGGVAIGLFSSLFSRVWKGTGISKFILIVWVVLAGGNLFGGATGFLTDFHIDTPLIAAVSIVIVTIVFAILMRAPTVQGRKLMDQIDGFKMYLETAEKNRLNFTGEPPMTISRFEAILPFAIALGVEKPWSQHFEGELSRNAVADAASGGYQPLWYSGRDWSSSGGFSNSVAAATTGMSAAMVAAQPVSASSSGFSGGGGGGSSGGGGGGGGGGGW